MVVPAHSNGKKKKDAPLAGGKGGNLEPATQTSDTRMLEKAVRQKWDLPEGIMEKLPAAMAKIGLSSKASHRNRIAAARVLVVMHGQNEDDAPKSGQNTQINVGIGSLPPGITLYGIDGRLDATGAEQPGQLRLADECGKVGNGPAPPGVKSPAGPGGNGNGKAPHS